ncbi:hypothetical protein AN1V17_00120 [Vallitalea sediminicola]
MKKIGSTDNEGNTDFNDLDGVPEGIIEKKPEHQNTSKAHPYMGNLTSHEIGMMAKSGALDGDMFKRMISNVEQDTEDGPTLP